MKYIILLIKKQFLNVIFSLIFMTFFYESYSQDLIWKANSTGTNNNYGTKSIINSQNEIYIVGAFNGTVNGLTTKGGDDAIIYKYDSNGNLIWTRQIGGTLNDYALDLSISTDDEYLYVAGMFSGTATADGYSITSTGGADGFIAKYNKNGNIIWLKDILYASGNSTQRPNGIALDKNNHLVIGGLFSTEIIIGTNTSNRTLSTSNPVGMFIAQIDTAGNAINAKSFDSSNSSSRVYTIDVDTSGYYLAGHYKGNLYTDFGTYTSNNNSLDMYVYKLDYSFNSKWFIKASGTADDQIFSCSVDNKNNFYFGGHFASSTMTIDSIAQTLTTTSVPSLKTATNKTADGKTDIFFAKYSYDGKLQWFNTAGSTENDYLYRALYNKGNFIAAGQYGASLTFNNKTIVPKNNADAFAIVQNQYDNLVYLIPFGGSSGSEVGETAVVDNNGNFVVIGDYTSNRIYIANQDSLDNSNPGTKDMFIAKFDKAGLDSIVVHPTCPGLSTGAINITPTGTLVDPITYSWAKDGDISFTSSSQNIANLSAGTYRVTFTDALGYSKSKSFLLKDPTPVSVTLNSSSNVSCFNGGNGAIDITASGGSSPYTYAWTANGGSGINAVAEDQTTLTVGQYSVIVTDKNDCPGSLNNIVITQPDKVTFTGTDVVKINGSLGSVDLVVHGGTPAYTFTWAGPSGYVAYTEDISGLSVSGNYIVTVTDANFCNADTTVYVIDSHVLNAYLGSKQNVLCKGESTGSITIATDFVTGTATYTWSPNVGNTATVTNLSAGSYSVTVTDDKPSSAVVNVTIAEPVSDLSVSISRANITCFNANDGILDANAAGGTLPYTYNWVKDAQSFDGGNETQINLSEGAYSVTVTDANNCTANANQSIINPNPVSFFGTPYPVTCEGGKNDGSVVLSNIQGGTGTYTYLWSNGQTSQNATLLASNTYWVTVTDGNNCRQSNNYFVGYEAPIIINITPTNVTCNGAGNGILNTSVSGGHPGFTYIWSTGGSSQSISGLIPGTYTVTVTDNKLCVKTKSADITEPLALNIASVNQNNVACFGGNTGSITVIPGGGTPQYTYSWDQGAGSAATASGLPAGNYNVTVTDVNNCNTIGSYTITQPGALGVIENVNAHVNVTCNGQTNGSLTLIPTGGSGIYEYSLNGGIWGSSATFTGLPAANYSYAVRDANAITCSFAASQNISITQPQPLSIVSETAVNATSNSPWNGSVSVSATGGTLPLTYTLDVGSVQQSTGDYTGLAAGIYSVSVNDANNCGPVNSSVLTISDATSISIINGGILKIYPIPATDYIYIEYDGNSIKTVKIALYSLSGKLVYIDNISAEVLKSKNYRIDISNLVKGMYILKLDDNIINEKIVVQ